MSGDSGGRHGWTAFKWAFMDTTENGNENDRPNGVSIPRAKLELGTRITALYLKNGVW
jgi:hypothetical protein